MAQPILTARGLVKRYGRVTALDNADFDLMPGEILAVIGDNGAGKSSLIKAISGAVTPDEGEIRLDGSPIRFTSPMQAREAGIETVYQNLALSPALSIADNMFMGREIRMKGFMGDWLRKLDKPAMEDFSRKKLSELGLLTIQNIHQAVETLSGGQRQGVAVARAAAFGSKVVILDEPTAGQFANIESITAVVIGGISLFGGRGSILGMLFGALIVGVFALGLRLLGTDPQWTYLLIGLLIIFAVAIDQWIRKVAG